MARARQARREGVSRSEPAVEPPQADPPAQTWRIWAGQPCASSSNTEATTWSPVATDNSEALGKCLRRTQRKAAGEELGPAPVNRCVVNVGTAIEPPSRRSGGTSERHDRRRPMARQRDGALVVVRGRESRPQGEGGQRVRSEESGTLGGRW